MNIERPFYQYSKAERKAITTEMELCVAEAIKTQDDKDLLPWLGHTDTYLRKQIYVCLGRFYCTKQLGAEHLLSFLEKWLTSCNYRIRQTVIYTAGELAQKDFETIRFIFDKGLIDPHHAVKNALIGSIKKAGAANPKPLLQWAGSYLHHPDPEIRRAVCHGIELRGRTHPEEVLPLLQQLQHDDAKRVRAMLVHVLGQIAYKKGCLEKVLHHLHQWDNKALVGASLEEILAVHERYKNFAFYTVTEAREMAARFGEK